MTLERFDIGRVLGQSFKACLTCFKPLIVGFLILFVPIFLTILAFAGDGGTTIIASTRDSSFMANIGTVLAAFAVILIIATCYYGYGIKVVYNTLNDQPFSILSLMKDTVKDLPNLAFASLLLLVLIVLGLILLIIPGILVYITLVAVLPIVSHEGRNAFNALDRSAKLTKGCRWAIFWVFLIVTIIANIGEYITQLLAFALFNQANISQAFSSVFADPASLGKSLALFALLLPSMYFSGVIYIIAQTVTYNELRRVKEGYAPTDLAEAFD